VSPALAENSNKSGDLDARVRKFLASQKGKWVDWNVPEVDGKVLYDLIIKNHYQKAVEIGGCFTAHNAAANWGGIKEFLDYVKSRPNFDTSIDRSSSAGISISYKIDEK
jgi:hypothetical protein